MLKPLALAVAIMAALSADAHAAQLCAWMVETNETDEIGTSRVLKLWLQSDSEIDFYIKMAGDGIVTGQGKMNSPMSATYTLHPNQPDSPWSIGGTLDPPSSIDVTAEIHQTPADIFSDAPTPLLAKFVFKRKIPDSEKAPSKIFQKKQCTTVNPPPTPAPSP